MNASESGLPSELVTILAQKVVGQPRALHHIVPYIQMYQAGLAPEGRPIGNFLLLGPTGTGKTRTVEVLAEVLHGNHQHYLKIDCGEFQMEHEIAKLIGAPPGYLGHRETVPVLSAKRLSEVTSPACDISLVLFDEIEKAAPSLTQLLLGVLDRAILKLGDNTSVNFEKSLIFLTSNLGASDMMKEMRPMFGFDAGETPNMDELAGKLEAIALGAVRKRFSPEFVNRIDAVVTYQPLAQESLNKILEQIITELQNHVNTRLGPHCFQVEVTQAARQFLLDRGTSTEYGARELKRVVHRQLMQPLATMVVERRIPDGSRVIVDVHPEGDKLAMNPVPGVTELTSRKAKPQVLIVDDNTDLLVFLKRSLAESNWDILTAETSEQARTVCATSQPDVALVDYLLPDLNGLELSSQLRAGNHGLKVIIMTGGQLSADEQELCRKYGYLLIQKPFMIEDLTELIRNRLNSGATVRAAG
jgi:ATP-dependent Clp protease ATP-binding subunit ClpA/CheY-like chemotaxis protein